MIESNLSKVKKGQVTNKYDLIVCDFMSMSYKYFYGLKNLSNRNGEKTGLYHGFFQCLLNKITESPRSKVIIAHEGDHLVRKQMSSLYKSQRKKRPDELQLACNRLRDLLSMFGADQRFIPGYEADDVAGSVVKGYRKALLISGDMDWCQILRKNFCILQDGKEISYDKLEKKLGYPPDRILIYKLLTGDSSDHIKGISGFPIELAIEFAKNCKTLKEVYSYIPIKKEHRCWVESIKKEKENNVERYGLLKIKDDGIMEEVICQERKNLIKFKKELLKLELFKVLNLTKNLENSGYFRKKA
jgi:5'-3' exonuclease